MNQLKVYPNIQGLIFDCDGTLADTTGMHLEAWAKTLSHFGLPSIIPQNLLIEMNGLSTAVIAQRINAQLGLDFDIPHFTQMKDHLVGQLLVKASPITPIVNIVHQNKGVLPMAVVSGGSRENVLLTLTALNLLESFQTVITADDPFPPKSEPEIFLQAAKILGVQPEFCQVFEDGESAIAGAKKAGMHVVDVRGVTQIAATPH